MGYTAQTLKEQKEKHITLCEKALWGLVNCNMLKGEVDSSYNRGYRLGFKEAKRLGIGLIEKVIEGLKKK